MEDKKKNIIFVMKIVQCVENKVSTIKRNCNTALIQTYCFKTTLLSLRKEIGLYNHHFVCIFSVSQPAGQSIRHLAQTLCYSSEP
jgi:hypothetical protein